MTPTMTARTTPIPAVVTIRALSEGFSILHLEERTQLVVFLETELRLFDEVQGSIDRLQHVIQLKRSQYRPRNPVMQAIIDQYIE